MHTNTAKTEMQGQGATPWWSRRVKDQLVMIVMVIAMGTMLLAPMHGYAGEKGTTDDLSDAGLGVASFFVTIPYSVAKVVYAGLGTIVGGFTYVLTGGSKETADAVWIPSWRGTYVITPDHLKGKKPVRFIGLPSEFDEHP